MNELSEEFQDNENIKTSDAPINISNEQLIRNDLVSTAASFLTNPKVAQQPQEKKIKFLKSKQLTDAEIEAALAAAGSNVNSSSLTHYNHNIQPYNHPLPSYNHNIVPYQPPLPPPPTIWSQISQTANFLFFLSGITFVINYFYKYYLGPYLTGRHPKTIEESLFEVQESVQSILQQVQNTLQSVEDAMHKQEIKVQELHSKDSNSAAVQNLQVEELKNELNTLKGILLAKNSFPASPASAVSIPEWQKKLMQTKKDDQNEATTQAEETGVSENNENDQQIWN